MSDESKRIAGLFLSSGIFASSGILGRFLAFVGHLIIVQFLAPSVFGDLTLAYTIVASIVPIALFGLRDGFPRLLAGAKSDRYKSTLVSSGLTVATGVALIGTTIVVLLTPLISEFFNKPALTSYLPPLTLYIFFSVIGGSLIGVLRGYQRSKTIALSKDIAPKIGGLLILLPVAWIVGPELGAISYYLSLSIVTTIAAGAALWFWVGVSPVQPSLSHARELLSFSWPLALSSTFVMFMLNTDIVFLGYLADSEAVGLYRAVRPLAQLVLIGLTSSVVIYMPLVTGFFEEGDYSAVDRTYTVVAKWLAILTFPLVGIFVIFAPGVVTGFFGTEYGPAAIVLSILSLGMYGRVLAGPNGATTQAIGRPKTELYAGLVGFIVNALLNAFLIPLVGFAGAAIATSTGFFAYNILELTIIYREVGSHPFSWDMVKPLVPSGLLGVGLYLSLPGEVALPVLISIGMFWTVCQLVFVPLTGSFGPMDKDILLQIDSPVVTQFIIYMERLENI